MVRMTIAKPQSTRCEAATALGERCQGNVAHLVDLGGRDHARLCGAHARKARQGRMTLWRPGLTPPPKRFYTKGPVWTETDETYLTARPDVPLAEIAAHLGRTVEAVRQRRYVLRRRDRA